MKQLDKIKKNTILISIITIIILFFVLKDDFENIVLSFQKFDKKYIIIGIFFYFLSISLKGYSNYLIVNNKKKVSLLEAIKHNIIVQFFNGVTPFATGGQPMEIYMLTEHKIPALTATNQTIQGFIFYQIALVVCGIAAVICNYYYSFFPKIKILRYFVFGGFLVNIMVVILLLLLSYSKKITTGVINIGIQGLKKLKIKVDEKKVDNKIDIYHQGFQELKKRKNLAIIGIFLNISSLLALYIIPFFIAKGMHISSLSIIETVTASSYVYILGSFIPIPGSSGGIEYGFTQFFGNFITQDYISAVLIIWRFITYYIGIITGAILFNIEKKEIK